MSDQERTIAYSAEDVAMTPLPVTEEEAIQEPDAAENEELTNAEYAELIGEDTEEAEEEPEETPSVPAALEPVRPVPRKSKKRRKQAEQTQPVHEDRHWHRHTTPGTRKIADPDRPLHNIGGTDTLKTTGNQPSADQSTVSPSVPAYTDAPIMQKHESIAKHETITRLGSAKHESVTGHETTIRTESKAFDHASQYASEQENTRQKSTNQKNTEQENRKQKSTKQTRTEQKTVPTHENVSREDHTAANDRTETRTDAPSSVQPRHLKTSQPTSFLQDMSRGGSASARAARSYLSGHDSAEQIGERNLRRYGAVIADTAGILAAAGGRAEAKQQQFASRQFTEGAVNAEKAIAGGFIRREDLLLSKKALREKLMGSRSAEPEKGVKTGAAKQAIAKQTVKDTPRLSKAEQWGIVKNRRAIYDALVVKEELVRLKDTSPDKKHVFARTKVAGRNVIGISRQESKKQVKILTSDKGQFFNNFKYGAWTQNMIAVYFSKHEDPMLRRINPARMRIRELKHLLAQSDRYRLKPTDISMIRTLIRGKSAMKHRQADRFSGLAGSFRSVRAITRRGVRYLEQTDDATAEGYRKLTTVYQGIHTIKPAVHLASSVGVKTAGAVWHLPPVAYARHAAMKPVQKGAEAAVSAVKTAGRSAADTVRTIAAHRIAGAQAGETIASATTRELVRTTGAAGAGVRTVQVREKIGAAKKAIATGKSAKRTAGRLSRRIKRLKQSRVIRSASFIGRRIGNVLHITTAPMRWTAIGFSKLYHGIRKIIASVLVLLFAAILLFMLLLMFSAFITSVGNATGEIIEKVVTDDDLAAHIRHLNDRNLAKFQEAVDIVKAGPRHDAEHIDSTGKYPDEAYGGEKLYHYGSPKDRFAPDANLYHNDLPGEVPGGFHYIYLDANGQMIGNNTNNTKDIICLTSVMVGNDYDEDAITLAPDLMDLWFDYLNPAPTYTVSELYHKEGTDLFPHGEYTFDEKQYHCTDSDFYSAYEAAKTDGVVFYETPAVQTTDGCRTDWTTYWNDYESWWDGRPEYPDYPDYDDYEDEEEWKKAKEAYYEAVEEYRILRDLWYDRQPHSDDYHYCPGHDALSCSYGYRDVNVYVTVLTKNDVYTAAGNGNILTYRVPTNYTCTTWETRSVTLTIPAIYGTVTKPFVQDGGWTNPKHQEWCDHLYAGDWYSLYGVDTYEDSVSLPTGEGRLSQEQIDEMIARIGDVSTARQAIVSFALDYVGRIPYYWGGKPNVPGFEGNHFGTIIDADYKGRNRKGLDCSGFVGWVYWSVTGIRPSPWLTTSDIVPSLGLRRIGFDELMPGDIGMEALPGAGSNHIGYFVGYNDDGRAKWVHESSGAGSVAVNTANCFRYYYRLFED